MSDGGEHGDGRVTIVVLTHERCAEVLHTVAHLSTLPERAPVIVVDNASRDGTAETLAARFPAVTAIRIGKRHPSQNRVDRPFASNGA